MADWPLFRTITRGSYLFFLKPVITALLALVILAQPITAVQVIAIVVICSSVLIELFWNRISRITGLGKTNAP